MLKCLIRLFVLLLLSFSVVTGGITVSIENNTKLVSSLQQETKVYIEPENVTASVGENFTISVKIANVTNLYGFDIQLRWGTAVLKYVSHTVFAGKTGGVLNSPVLLLKNVIDESGYITGAANESTCWIAYTSITSPPSGFNGSGTAFNMTFQVIRDGECDIYLTYTELPDTSGNSIPHEREDGYFYRPGLGKVPVANFTLQGGKKPGTSVENKLTVFNASSSYDQDPSGHISLYIWNFGDGTPPQNTTNPSITHNFTNARDEPYMVELTVLDDQGVGTLNGSQSKPRYQQVKVVPPNPVAEFSIWPNPAVINKTVIFDASASYDPDPEGNITKYMWNFGDGTKENTTSPIINHTYTSFPGDKPGGAYPVTLTVEDSESLNDTATLEMAIVERRDVEATNVALSTSELLRGDHVTINGTITNNGPVDENFNVTAYYNKTATEWAKIDQLTMNDFLGQNKTLSGNNKIEPLKWQLEMRNSTGNSINKKLLNTLSSTSLTLKNSTKVMVGTNIGYWTINPGELNNAPNSTNLVVGTPLPTGGWVLEDDIAGPEMIYGVFSAGNWTFQVRLYANETGVNATIWVRILKSNNQNPQADGAVTTVLKNWTALFSAEPLTTSPEILLGTVQMPSITFFGEYLYVEFQLEVVENSGGSSTKTVIFQIGANLEAQRTQIWPTAFSYQEQITLDWDTELVPPGNYTIKLETSEIPHETNITNNVQYSSKVHVMAHNPVAKFSFAPITPYPGETVTFDASETYVDRFLNITAYVWDFGDGTNATVTSPTITHVYNVTGNYNVVLTVIDSFNQTDAISRQISVEVEYVPLDVKITVGKIYFKGEIAEFYVSVSRSGGRINASEITAFIIFNNSVSELSPTEIKFVDTGVYLISFQIPVNASPGVYALVVDASYLIPPNINLQGTTIESFMISSTLTNWDAKLISINGTLLTVNSTLGTIQANITAINARLVSIDGTLATIGSTLGFIQANITAINARLVSIDGTLATIGSAVGMLETDISNLNATVTMVAGDIVTIETTLGDVQTSINGVQSTLTIGLAAASILAATATIVAILILLIIKKINK